MKVAFITDTADFQFDLYSICAKALSNKIPHKTFAVFYNNIDTLSAQKKSSENLSFFQIKSRSKKSNFIARFLNNQTLKKQLNQFEPDVVFFSSASYVSGKWRSVVMLDPFPKILSPSLLKRLKKSYAVLTYPGPKKNAAYSNFSEKVLEIEPMYLAGESHQQSQISFRKRNTEEHDYFLLSVDKVDHAVVFLKGFSQFKQWQKSQIRLVIAIPDFLQQELAQKLALYKFRDSVFVVQSKEETQDAIREGFGNFIWNDRPVISHVLLQATAQNNPLFLPDEPALQALFDGKSSFFEKNEKSIFASMTQLYKETISIQEQALQRKRFLYTGDSNPTLQSIGKLLEP
ncbi:MAG: hypothetical protein RL582_548 [Bacteroidota bacterium]